MSEYRFIASDRPLPEIDLRGIVRMTVKDYKNLHGQTQGLNHWNHIDDDAEVLYAKDESTLGWLTISLCKNPPFGISFRVHKSIFRIHSRQYPKRQYY